MGLAKGSVPEREPVANHNNQIKITQKKDKMKTKNMLFGMMLMASASLGFSSCNNSPIVEDEYFEKSAAIPTITDFPELVSGEEAGLLLMREEEKMAHDVYMVLGQTTDLVIFDNIASSETNHYNAIGYLISNYKLADPSTGVEGTFTNPDLAALYEKLVAAGKVSLTEALKTGALIEETDIADLEKLLATTTNSALLQVYGNLLRGSRNHLRAFVSTLGTYNVKYTPTVLSTEAYTQIVTTPMETGNGNGNMNGNGNKNSNGKGKGNSGKGNGNSNRGGNGQNGNGSGTGTCING